MRSSHEQFQEHTSDVLQTRGLSQEGARHLAFGEHGDLSSVDVRVMHSQTDEIGALAYTRGSELHFSGGPGHQMLAHEAAHVVQQGSGRVGTATS